MYVIIQVLRQHFTCGNENLGLDCEKDRDELRKESSHPLPISDVGESEGPVKIFLKVLQRECPRGLC